MLLWQFDFVGGVHLPVVSICAFFSIYLWICHCTDISLYFLTTWLFRMGSHWWHWRVKSSLSLLVVSKGGVILPLVSTCFYMHCYFLMFSYKLTILNGLSFMPLKSKEFTVSSSSFGGGRTIRALHLPNLSSQMFRCAHQKGLFASCKTNNVKLLWWFLYFLFSWPFRMGSHWRHWTAKKVLWQFWMGGSSAS